MTPRRLQRHCLSLAALLALVLLLCAFGWPAWVAAATLPAAVASVNVILGCLLLAMIVPLVRGAWQPLLLPGARLGAKGVPVIVPMLLPVLIGMGLIYPWVGASEPGFRGFWLSPWTFCLRTLLYGALWWTLQRWVLRGAASRYPAGVILLVLLSSLAAVDWLMSLQPGFFSSLFGLLQIARQLLDGLALAGWLVLLTRSGVRLEILRALLVVALAFWLYLHAVHYLIIVSVDLPREAQWYLLRGQGPWSLLTVVLMVAQVLCLLWLASPLGLRLHSLQLACPLLLVLGALEAIWMILPSLPFISGIGALLLVVIAQLAYAAAICGGLIWAWRRELEGGRHE
jgi:hypothetical protein